MTTAFLILTAVVAVADWIAVARGAHRIEFVAKPLTLILLIIAASTADLGSAKGWVLAALALGLIGDVALMFATDTDSADSAASADSAVASSLDAAFLAGLGAFLLGHLAYFGAFVAHGQHGWQAAAGVLVVGGATVLAVPRVLRGAHSMGGTALASVVGIYAAVLAVMVVLAFGTAAVATAIGGLVFLGSDTTLAWNRFVQPLQRGPVVIIVSYHVAQVLIVIGLMR